MTVSVSVLVEAHTPVSVIVPAVAPPAVTVPAHVPPDRAYVGLAPPEMNEAPSKLPPVSEVDVAASKTPAPSRQRAESGLLSDELKLPNR
jgi:hypothetical protein